MPTTLPFSPRAHSTQKAEVAAGSNINIPLPQNVSQVWIDNRGASDLLIEFDDQPLEENSFRVPPNAAMTITHPSSGNNLSLHLSRPAGATTEVAFITPGIGF